MDKILKSLWKALKAVTAVVILVGTAVGLMFALTYAYMSLGLGETNAQLLMFLTMVIVCIFVAVFVGEMLS